MAILSDILVLRNKLDSLIVKRFKAQTPEAVKAIDIEIDAVRERIDKLVKTA